MGAEDTAQTREHCRERTAMMERAGAAGACLLSWLKRLALGSIMVSKPCPQTSNIGTTWELFGTASFQAHLRLTESKTLGIGQIKIKNLCFNKASM